MRDIKFRAWDFIENMMMDASELSYGIQYNKNKVEIISQKDCFVFLQYTGLKDKNGVEIYEGNIVKTKNSLYKVIYDKCCFWGIDEMGKYPIYQIKHYIMEDEIFEVIGNIYENPELLKED